MFKLAFSKSSEYSIKGIMIMEEVLCRGLILYNWFVLLVQYTGIERLRIPSFLSCVTFREDVFDGHGSLCQLINSPLHQNETPRS